MKRADPKTLTEADYIRAKRNVEKTKKLFEKGKTPNQLIFELLNVISHDRSLKNYKCSHCDWSCLVDLWSGYPVS